MQRRRRRRGKSVWRWKSCDFSECILNRYAFLLAQCVYVYVCVRCCLFFINIFFFLGPFIAPLKIHNFSVWFSSTLSLTPFDTFDDVCSVYTPHRAMSKKQTSTQSHGWVVSMCGSDERARDVLTHIFFNNWLLYHIKNLTYTWIIFCA